MENIIDYTLKLFIYFLITLIIIAFAKVIFEIVTNPEQFDAITFGIFDNI